MLGTEVLFYKMCFNVVNLEILLAKYFFKSDFVFVRLINKTSSVLFAIFTTFWVRGECFKASKYLTEFHNFYDTLLTSICGYNLLWLKFKMYAIFYNLNLTSLFSLPCPSP